MGRPKTYRPDEALQQMTTVFWKRGYHATTLSDLEGATGVSRKTLLNDFGNKTEIFWAVLEHYLDIKAKPDGAVLFNEPLGPHNVRAFFESIRYREGDEWGCLLALTLLEQESAPEGAADLIRGVYSQLEEAFLANLLPAVKEGRLDDEEEAQDLARFLLNTLHGIVVNGRAGTSNSALAGIVAVALSVVPT